jgi:hypothetical protein
LTPAPVWVFFVENRHQSLRTIDLNRPLVGRVLCIGSLECGPPEVEPARARVGAHETSGLPVSEVALRIGWH